MACLRALHAAGARILLIHWPVNPEAPFQFDFSFCAAHHSRDQLDGGSLSRIVGDFSPDLILCSGWMDKAYVNLCRQWHGKVPTVLTMDNHWTGSLKQQVWRAMAPITVQRTFSHAFVPGEAQKAYALKLGFSADRVKTGFYTADTARFHSYYRETEGEKAAAFPKRFLYLGRYVRHKGIFDLWEAFQRFRLNHPDWELWCAGTGDQFENRVESQGIRHFGFVQPADLLPILQQTGVYILPSHFEPWGVSVQEMAVAGFPMLLSDRIGAREAFLAGERNGKTFGAGHVHELELAMRWMADQPVEKLLEMSKLSHALGMSNTPALWAEKVISFASAGVSKVSTP